MSYDGRRNYSSGNGGGGNSSSSGNSGMGNSGSGTNYYTERMMPIELRDQREGKSPMSRRYYMESKELNRDKSEKVKDLEKYLKELSEDIVEMIQGASPEEKQLLEKKMSQLTTKISQM